MKLDFVVPGFSKCGTTTLCSLLCAHPDIFIPEVKEPNFFESSYEKGWDWYEGLFAGAKEEQLWGEGSTSYSTGGAAQRSCRRIVKYFPGIRVIFIARNPVKRLESSFREFHHSGYKYGIETPDDFAEALRALPNMIADSRYWSLINIYRDHVPDNRIHVLFLEDLNRDPAGELQKCFAFLGVDEDVPVGELGCQMNAGSTKYRDTQLIRRIRRNRLVNRCLSLMGNKHQHELERRLGLRKPFDLAIAWTPETRQWLHESLGNEVKSFLKFYGKPEGYWGIESWANEGQGGKCAAA